MCTDTFIFLFNVLIGVGAVVAIGGTVWRSHLVHKYSILECPEQSYNRATSLQMLGIAWIGISFVIWMIISMLRVIPACSQ